MLAHVELGHCLAFSERLVCTVPDVQLPAIDGSDDLVSIIQWIKLM